ncbi:LPXTG cell wall anchor domain-containing protein [Rathayibacter sp. VKM Ac-2630]|uniref:LPXTG cell wall anchor domain-containing protein n=1 Tax=Rathayibacter sp. VKM Ac-2630 TaxID=1938617 RepID=UPI000982355B|nr:LPXTG cell wall anchor domain-containing protein [Rathayibacter sp. VKM Ac-2630]OOB90376.1 hypothetical protein B0T42_11910 [Rathayibacter sp. VKM Ac-2630]
MDSRARTIIGGLGSAVVLSITAAGVLVGAGPAAADEKDGIAANGGIVQLDFGPEWAGWTAVAGSRVPGSGGGVTWTTASLDTEGDGSVTTYAGPVDVYLSNPSDPTDDPPLDTYSVTAYRGETSVWTIDTATKEGRLLALPVPDVPSLDELENGRLIPLTDYDIAPAQYEAGVAFDLAVSGLQFDSDTPFDLDDLAVTGYLYSGGGTSDSSGPAQLDLRVIEYGAYTQTIPAEFTTDPHTYASYDEYGRLIAAATLDGGASSGGPAATPAPTATAAPVAPSTPAAVTTSGRTGRGTLASTGAETAGLAAGGAALLLAGAVSLLAVKRRASRA